MAKLRGNIIITGKIRALTGLHIGGSSESLSIGGVDLPVVRTARDRYPYIPGSSIKGKLRMLTEFAEGDVTDDKPVQKTESKAAQIFGISPPNPDEKKDTKVLGPTRITVRDAHPDKPTIKMWEELDTELLYTENKSENTVDRITSKANPRSIERVVPGSCFDLEIVYSSYDMTGAEPADAELEKFNDLDNLAELFRALRLLEQNTLGGHGSRGYGKIVFEELKIECCPTSYYHSGDSNEIKSDKLNLWDVPENLIDNIKNHLNA